MAVEPNTANESAAELQDPAPGVLLTDEDLESPSKSVPPSVFEKVKEGRDNA